MTYGLSASWFVVQIVSLHNSCPDGDQIWDLFEGHRLFRAVKGDMFNDELHLAEMVSLMGPPPKEFLQRSERCRQYWDSEGSVDLPLPYEVRNANRLVGNWIAATPIPEQSLESLEERLKGPDKVLLLNLLRKILRWLPEE